jgi:LmbE family N-acetylglucosaminyl deacetylase
MNVLAIGAHPDDLELLCGGTLARYAQAGHDVFMAIATNGEVGSATLSKEQTAELRHEEASRSCARIGATLIWMGFPDEWLFDTPEVRSRFIDAIREARPEVMFVHSTDDYHPDHRVAGQVAVDARIPSTVRLVETQLPPAARIPHIFVMDTIGATAFDPELYVDISDVWDAKKAMLEEHQSQAEHLRRSFGIEYAEFMEVQARQRGVEAGCRLAEAFREVKTFPVTGSASLLPGP